MSGFDYIYKKKKDTVNTRERNSDYGSLKQDNSQASWQCLTGGDIQLLPAPFSIVPVILYLILEAKARSYKGFRVLEVKFCITYYFSPMVPKRGGRAPGQVLACSPGKHLKASGDGHEGTPESGAYSIQVTRSSSSKIKLGLRTACSHPSLRTFRWSSPGAFPRGPAGPWGACPCWRWAPASPHMPRCSHILWGCGWHQEAGPSRQDTSEALRTGSDRDRVAHRVAGKTHT